MVTNYPHSVPPYNKWRYETPDSVNTADRTQLVVDTPQSLTRFILGAINLLTEVYVWTDKSTLSQEDMVDLFNNEVFIMALCDAVAGCIASSDDVRDELINFLQGTEGQSELIRTIVQYQQNPNETTVQQISDNQSLDYVYGALVSAWQIVLDTWELVAAGLSAAATFTDALLDLARFFPSTATAVLTGVDALFNAGPALTTAWIEAQAQQDSWVCGAFDSVCGRGQPYTLTAADIDAGFAALTGAPIPGTVTVLKAAADYTTIINYWKIRSDDDSSNDWETLCSCTPFDWSRTFDLSDPADQAFWDISSVFTGTWTASGFALVPQTVSGTQRVIGRIELKTTYDMSNLKNIQMQVNVVASGGQSTSSIVASNQFTLPNVSFPISPGIRDFDIDVTGAPTLYLQAQVSPGSLSGEGYITTVTLRGTGSNPFS